MGYQNFKLLFNPANSTPRYTHTMYSHKNMYTSIHSSMIHHSRRVNKMFINKKWIINKINIHTLEFTAIKHNEILLIYEYSKHGSAKRQVQTKQIFRNESKLMVA